MVVADPNRESEAALQYALSHAILENDTLILLYVENPNSWKNPFGAIFKKSSPTASSPSISSSSNPSAFSSEGGGGGDEFLEALKLACMKAQPKLKVVVQKVEINDSKEKGSVILTQCSNHGVDLLVIGQRRSLSNALLGTRRSGSLRGIDTADYLIENSKCTCVAVQRKGQNAGFLLNTKTHKNFWLLA